MQRRSDYLRERKALGKRRRSFWRWLLLIPAALLLAYLIYLIPPVHNRLSNRVDELRNRIVYFFRPPGEAVFLPDQEQELAVIVQQTLAAATAQALAAQGTATPTVPPDSTPLPSPTATITPTPLPASIDLPGVKYVDQHGRWNYCGPANLTMALNFWGWPATATTWRAWSNPAYRIIPISCRPASPTRT